MANTPTLTEFDGLQERRYDLFGRLLKDRIVFVAGNIDGDLAQSVIAQLLYLEAQNAEEDIFLYLNTPGGFISAGMAIYDTMQFVRPDIRTIGLGQACSMGALLLAAGAKGKRSALPHCEILIHQPTGGAVGQVTDIEIAASEMRRKKDELTRLYAAHSGQAIAKIAADIERDYSLTALEAVAYGLIDSVAIVEPKKRIEGAETVDLKD